MMIGDLVRVHWGNSDYSGTEDVDWGYGTGLVTGEIVYWNEAARATRSPIAGEVEILFRGERVNYNLGRCEVIGACR